MSSQNSDPRCKNRRCKDDHVHNCSPSMAIPCRSLNNHQCEVDRLENFVNHVQPFLGRPLHRLFKPVAIASHENKSKEGCLEGEWGCVRNSVWRGELSGGKMRTDTSSSSENPWFIWLSRRCFHGSAIKNINVFFPDISNGVRFLTHSSKCKEAGSRAVIP